MFGVSRLVSSTLSSRGDSAGTWRSALAAGRSEKNESNKKVRHAILVRGGAMMIEGPSIKE